MSIMGCHGWSYLSTSCFLEESELKHDQSRNDLKDQTNDGDKMWTLLCRVSETIFDKRSQHACALTESVADSLYIDGFTVIVLSCYCRKELLQCGVLNPEKDLYLGKLALTKFPKSPETWIHR